MTEPKGPKPIAIPASPAPMIDVAGDDLLIIRRKEDEPDVITPLTYSVSEYREFLNETPADSSQRNRWQFRFHLNLRHEAEFMLAWWLDDLKKERRFTTVIRDALRLYRDLKAGEYHVFRELFPDVYARILLENCNTPSEQFHQLMAEIAELKAANTPARTLDKIAMPRTLQEAEPVQLSIHKAASDGKAAQNFLESAFGLLE